MTFPEALALTRAAYHAGLAGDLCTSKGRWWDAAFELGLRHRAREQAKRHRPLLRDRRRVGGPARPLPDPA